MLEICPANRAHNFELAPDCLFDERDLPLFVMPSGVQSKLFKMTSLRGSNEELLWNDIAVKNAGGAEPATQYFNSTILFSRMKGDLRMLEHK